MNDSLKTYMQIDGSEPIENDLEFYKGLQAEINSGNVWLMQGSCGRSAMDAIKAGHCMTGKDSRRDYYGNVVPSRKVLEAGTFGSYEYVVEHHGADWADALAEVA